MVLTISHLLIENRRYDETEKMDKKKDKKTDDMVLLYHCQYCDAAAVGLPSYAYNNQIQLV